MAQYELVGKPYGSNRPAFEEAVNASVDDMLPGDKFDANLTDAQERAFVDGGILRKVRASSPPAAKKADK